MATVVTRCVLRSAAYDGKRLNAIDSLGGGSEGRQKLYALDFMDKDYVLVAAPEDEAAFDDAVDGYVKVTVETEDVV